LGVRLNESIDMHIAILIATIALSLLGLGTYLRYKAVSAAAKEVGGDYTTCMKHVASTPSLHRKNQAGMALHMLAVAVVAAWIFLR